MTVLEAYNRIVTLQREASQLRKSLMLPYTSNKPGRQAKLDAIEKEIERLKNSEVIIRN